MKSILISIKPEWVEKILNGEKTIEVRKTAPKCGLPVEVYIYCAKNKLHYRSGALVFNKDDCFKRSVDGTYKYGDSVELMGYSPDYPYDENNFLNGKVVAKFTLRKVEDVLHVEWPYLCNTLMSDYRTKSLIPSKFYDAACLSPLEIVRYGNIGKPLFAWHISDLEIFDRPRGLCEFHTNVKKEPPEELLCPECGKPMEYYEYKYLKKAPKSWQYIEVE